MRRSVKSALKYFWVHFVMWSTSWLGDMEPVVKLRGFLVRPALKKCGRNLQIASGTKVNFPSNVIIGNDVLISNYCWINATVTIEDEVMIGPFTVIVSGDHVFKNGSARFGGGVRRAIKIERGCWLGAHVSVLRGVTIGAGSLIAANAVVTRDVRAGTVNAGVPAREIADHVEELEPDPGSVGKR